MWEEKTGVAVSVATMSRAIRHKLGWSYKKRRWVPPSETKKIEVLSRSTFRERLRSVDPRRLVFVDESSTNIALTPRYARAPKGERAYGKAPRNWGRNVTLISSITLEGMGASMSIEGSSDTESFGLYMKNILTPQLERGQIVLMDNLSVHRSKWVRELIEKKGCQLWLLPSYSPDFNPIEEAFSKVKNLLRKAIGKNPRSTLWSYHGGTWCGQQGGRPRLLRALRL
jgi:transposase